MKHIHTSMPIRAKLALAFAAAPGEFESRGTLQNGKLTHAQIAKKAGTARFRANSSIIYFTHE